MMTREKTLLAAAGVILVLIGGGWAFARHEATSIAKDRVDGYIIRYNLRGKVTYEDLSASPFGSATLSDVRVILSPGNSIAIASLDVSNIDMKADELRAITISAHGAQVPLLAIAREENSNGKLPRNLIGMGYTILSGDIGASIRYDEQRGTLALESTGNIKDAGSWKARLSFANIEPGAMSALYSLTSALKQENGLAILAAAGQGIQNLNSLAIEDAEVILDNSGIHERDRQVTDLDLPPDLTDSIVGDPAGGEMELVKAGMTPSEAHANREALMTFISKGGTLKMATNLSEPLPLFRNGNLLTPSFTDPLEFLAATRTHVSN